jgi:hypothetical protein
MSIPKSRSINKSLNRILTDESLDLSWEKVVLESDVEGPCKKCNKYWQISSQSKTSQCSICGINLCPHCVKTHCVYCDNIICEFDHKDLVCIDCLKKCKKCSSITNVNKCVVEECDSCFKCDPARLRYGKMYCSKHVPKFSVLNFITKK